MRSTISAQFATGKLPLWSPNQAPTVVCCVYVGIAGIEQDNVTVDTPMLGGGFGRRGEVEFSVHATLIAMQAMANR